METPWDFTGREGGLPGPFLSLEPANYRTKIEYHFAENRGAKSKRGREGFSNERKGFGVFISEGEKGASDHHRKGKK